MVSVEDRNSFRILWHSVSPHIRNFEGVPPSGESGYGNVTRHVCSRLKKHGFNIFVTAYYGIEPGGVLVIDGLPCLPAKHGQFGEASCVYYYKSLKANLAILHSDPWAFDWFSRRLPSTLCYGPMDHINYPVEIQNIMRNFTYRVSISRFQQEEWRKYNPPVESELIQHGVDSKVFFPVDKKEAKKELGIPEDAFVLGSVSANSDKESRKGYTQMFKGLRLFFEENPDVKKSDFRYLLFTNPVDPRGLQLELFLKKQGLREITILQDPMIFETGIKDSELNKVYGAMDVQLYCSMREGWGIPITEGMCCGVPAIGHRFSAMTEQIEGRGWLCDSLTQDHETPINATTAIPDPYSIAKCIKDAYFNDELRGRYSVEARKYALTLDWDILVQEKWIPLLDSIIESCNAKTLEERKLV